MVTRSRSELVVILLAGASIVGGSWMMGGYFTKAPYWMGMCGLTAGLFSLFQLINNKRSRIDNPAFHWIWILWCLLLVYLLISLLNPAYSLVEIPDGSVFIFANPIRWLPSVVSVQESTPQVFQFIGSMIIAWSLLAIVRSPRMVRGLLIALIANAFVLSLIGSVLKLANAKSILGIFIAINDKFFASFTYHNHWIAFAGFHLMIATGLACFYAFHPNLVERRERYGSLILFLCVAAFFIFLSLFLSESRSGVLFGVVYMFIVFLYFVRRRWHAQSRPTHWIKWLVAVFVVLLGIFSWRVVGPQLSETSERVEEAWYAAWSEDQQVDDFRFNIGPKVTADLIEEKSIFGWGWGSYPLAMSIYSHLYVENSFAQHAHNDWLQFVSELGVFGCFIFLFPLVHMTIHFSPRNNLTRFCRLGILLLMGIALFEGPFSNPVILLSVLVVLLSDLGVKYRDSTGLV